MKDPDRPVPLDTVSGGGGVAGGGEEDKGGVRNVGSSGAGNSWNGSDQMMQGKWYLYFLDSILRMNTGYPDVGMGMRRGMRGGRPFRGRSVNFDINATATQPISWYK